MRYYTYTRGFNKSPQYEYFESIEDLNAFYGINSTIDDYNVGYSFEYEDIDGKTTTYFLGYDEEEEYDEICDFE